MADIELRVHGDGSEGKSALEGVGEAAGHAHEKTHDLAEGMKEVEESFQKAFAAGTLFVQGIEKLTEGVKEFAAESVKLYEAQEQADRNLQLVAGEMTGKLKEQAEAFEQLYGVEAKQTERLQTLALAHGADKAQVEALTEVTTKWAAITGTDAAGAAEGLTRAVETGRHSSRELGITWEKTGDTAVDLQNAIAALNDKLAGADPLADATLEGRSNKTRIAIDNLKISFGSFLSKIDDNLGVLDKVTGAIKAIGDQGAGTNTIIAALLNPVMAPTILMGGAAGGAFSSDDSGISVAEAPDRDANRRAPTMKMDAIDTKKEIARQDAEQKAWAAQEAANAKSIQQDMAFNNKQWEINLAAVTKELELEQKKNDEMLKEDGDMGIRSASQQNVLDAQNEERAQAADDKHLALLVTSLKEEAKEEFANIALIEKAQEAADAKRERVLEAHNKKVEKIMTKAGSEIGAALINAMNDALEQAMSGQDVKWQAIAGSLVQTIFTIVGTAVGAVYGMPQLGGAAGGLLGGVASYGINQIKHEGGPIERFHSGGWPGLTSGEVPIIAQVGEHMLSRRDVANMGGPSGVEQAKRGGGGGGSITIVAQDSADVQRYFEGRGGRGLRRAIKSGRGNAAALFAGALK